MKTDKLTELLAPVVQDIGYIFWGLEYQVRKADALLRIYIDHENGISVDDCATVSHEVSGILDVEEPISMAYILEVSSPGMDRILFSAKQFTQFIGQEVKIKLNQMVDGKRKIKGIIAAVNDEEITIKTEQEDIKIEFNQIMRARINPGFDGVK
ncbi:MAG TPA: ribosome maturation factor RimP [Oceanospirillales bacterium]|nr:ribosome maturation factor RimP [Oceanospirillales bacterium]